MIRCSIGVMAYNEAANIGALLDSLSAQETSLAGIAEIVVVASGCDDGTEQIALEKAARDPKIRVIVEAERRGKAAAINRFLAESRENILVLIGGDAIADRFAVERLTAPFLREDIGMVGARPTPLNRTDRFCGYAVHFIWTLHHRIALLQAKCGEMVAFRRTFVELPKNLVVDEPMIEALIQKAGLKIAYQPNAVVYNLGPDNIREIFSRRKNIVTGYLLMRRHTRYRVATMGRGIVMRMLLSALLSGDQRFLWALGTIAIELAARFAARADYILRPRRPYHLWRPAETTKKLPGATVGKTRAPVE